MSRSCLALLFLILAVPVRAQPPAKIDLAGDPLPPGAVARIGTVRFLPRPYLEQVFFTADGNTVIGRGADSVVQFWDAETGKPAGELRDPDLRNFRADQSPDGKFLALFGQDIRGKPAPDSTLRVYDLATRKPVWTQVIDEVYCYYWAVRYTPDGRHILTGTNADLRVWDARTGNLINKHKAAIGYTGLVLSPDGTLVAGGERALWVWDWAAGGPPRTLNLKPNRHYSNYLSFAPDSKTVYAQEYGRDADGYDATTGNFVGTADPSVVEWRAVSPDGKTVATSYYDKDKRAGWVVLRDATSGKEVGRLPAGTAIIRDGRWSKDGSRLVGASPFRAWVWDVAARKSLGPTAPGHENQVNSLTFTSDGRLFTCGDDGTVRVWDPATGKELARLLSGERYWRLAASGDGSLLAAAVQDKPSEVRVWDAKTGAEVYKLVWSTSRTGAVSRVQFTADDQTLLTYGLDFHLRAWDLVTGKLKLERKFRPPALGPEGDEDDPRRRDEFVFFDHKRVDVGSDGNTLVFGGVKDVTVYAPATGKERMQFEADEQWVEAVALSADARRLVTAGRGPAASKGAKAPAQPGYQVTVWDLAQGKQLCRFRAPGSTFFPVLTFTPDGKRVVTGSQDDRLRFWDAATGAAVGSIELPRSPVRVAFTPDGKRVAVAFYDPTVLVFDVAAALKR